MQRMNLLIKKIKIIIRDIIDPTPGLFIYDKLNPNEQNLQNTADKIFNLPAQIQQQLNETVLKKIIKQPILQATPSEIISNVVPKTQNFFIDDDEFDSFKKPEPTAINIGQPKDENFDNLVMISYDDEAKSSKSLLKLKIKNLK